MIPKNDIDQIINAAIMAPSGENCQPWQFRIIDNGIQLFNVPERDQSLYNFNQYGSLVSHGAAIENIIIASKHLNYDAKVDLFPNSQDKNLVANIIIEKSETIDSSMYEAIFQRTTNRKPYKGILLTDEQRKSIFYNNNFSGIEVQFTEDKERINKIADAVSVNEKILFANRSIHDFFFSHLRLTDEENNQTKNGFYFKTLELAPPQLKAMKLFKNWNVLNIFNKVIGVSKKISAENAKVFKNSAAMGIITIQGVDRTNFVNAGRVFQNIWLKTTKHKLSLQPLTGVLFFMRGIEAGETNNFNKKEIELIKNSYSAISNIFNTNNKKISLLFRIGDGGEPSARSPRMPMENFIKL